MPQGRLICLLLGTAHCVGHLKNGCRREKLSNVGIVQNGNFLPGLSLLQSDVSTFHTQHRNKNEQGDLPNIIAKAAATISTPEPAVDAGSHTTPFPVSPIPVIRHVKPAKAAPTESGQVDHDTGEVHKASIFKLKFEQLDKEAFWMIMLGMLVFTIMVDRLEWFAAKQAEHNMARQMYLNRLNAELMMFGLVSTVVFINEQFWEPTHENAILFEFVDVFCSLGACGLFLSGLVLFMLHHWMQQRWSFFVGHKPGVSMRSAQRIQGEQAAASKLLETVLHSDSLKNIDVQHCEFVIMSARFKKAHSLPDSFNYAEYLKLCLTDSICDLININWISWLLVLAFTGLLYLAHVLHPDPYTPNGYVTIFSCGVWTLFIVHVLVLVVVLQAKVHLTRGLGCNALKPLQESLRQAVQSRNDLSGEPVQRLNAKLVSALEQVIQIVGLSTSFQGSFFVMHVLHNMPDIRWRVAMILPIVVDGVILLPFIISYFTVIKGYYSPEHAIVDSTLEWSTKLEEDLRFVAKQLQPGEPLDKYRNSMRTSSKEAFMQSLSDMGLHVSPQRAHRIYSAFESNGGVDLNALIDALREQNSAIGRPESQSLVGRAGALIHDSLVGRPGWGSAAAVPTTMVGGGSAAPSSLPLSSVHTHGEYDGLGLRGLAVPQQTTSALGSGSSLQSKYNVIY